ncbi:ribonuclease T2-A-like [Polyodon spathula]|uniref:ribonuclease T2-A-like n=1 Tax=Polyodon spathula TaxID=7913 RepID=UPI001B7E6962|nr:ribonuclease T2-A-like [Polyodon spathula]
MSLLKCSLFIVVLLNSTFHSLLVNSVRCSGTPSSILLTQRWAKTECKDPNLKGNPACNSNKWTLHGLWPDKVKVIDADPLTDDFFNTFENYQQIMRTDWTFLGSADQNTYIRETKKFWNHEWMKHGYCAKDFIGSDQPKPYFEKALELYRSEDLLSRLTSSGIKPRDDKTYQEYEVSISDIITHFVYHCKSFKVDVLSNIISLDIVMKSNCPHTPSVQNRERGSCLIKEYARI